jgi:hypothetical protein
MIVNYTKAGWLIITQRSHGLLAAQICAQWKKSQQPQRWVETLIATAEHDDAHQELEREDLLEETGGPKNFKAIPFEEAYCEKLLNLALSKGRYIALLISRHIQFLYGQDPRAKSYCQDLKKREKRWMKEAQTTQGEINKSYQLLEFCDALSLLICQQAVQPENRTIEISKGPDGKSYQLRSTDNEQLTVAPWPFEANSFKVNYESRLLGQLTFKDTVEFKQVFFSAPVELQEITISRES